MPPVGHERRGHHHHLLKQTRETSSPKPGNACLRPCGKGRRSERRAAPWKRSARGASKSRAPFRAAEVMQTQPLRAPHPAPPPPLPLSEAAGACRLDFFLKKGTKEPRACCSGIYKAILKRCFLRCVRVTGETH